MGRNTSSTMDTGGFIRWGLIEPHEPLDSTRRCLERYINVE